MSQRPFERRSVELLVPGLANLDLDFAFLLTRKLDKVGTTISATSSEASMAKVTVRAKGINSWPTMPPTNIKGMKIATVARVADVIGFAISLAPPIAASLKPSPRWRRRYMTSTITMLSSIKRPTAIDMALKVRRLMVRPNARIARKPISRLNGIDIAVTNEARTAVRKRKTITIARAATDQCLVPQVIYAALDEI